MVSTPSFGYIVRPLCPSNWSWLKPFTDMEFEWHKIRLVMAEMVHFIRQLETYCRLEVIECSWKILVDFLNKKEGDLDALIDAHRTYLERVTKKILLWNPRPGKEVRVLTSRSWHWPKYPQELLLRQLGEIFTIILQYREATVRVLLHQIS